MANPNRSDVLPDSGRRFLLATHRYGSAAERAPYPPTLRPRPQEQSREFGSM
jgi:hypothetical protein